MRNRAKRGIVLERCYVWLTFKHRILLREKEVRTNVKHCKNPCRAPEKEFQKVVLKYWRRFGLKPEKYWFDWFGQGEITTTSILFRIIFGTRKLRLILIT